MSPMSNPDDFILEWIMKIGALFTAFVGGIWAVATKVKGFESRIQQVEVGHTHCKSVILKNLEEKIDNLPDRVEAKMEEKFNRVHERMDDIILNKAGKR